MFDTKWFVVLICNFTLVKPNSMSVVILKYRDLYFTEKTCSKLHKKKKIPWSLCFIYFLHNILSWITSENFTVPEL